MTITDAPGRVQVARRLIGTECSREAYHNADSAFQFQDFFLGQHQVLCSSIVLSALCTEPCLLMSEAGVQLRRLQRMM